MENSSSKTPIAIMGQPHVSQMINMLNAIGESGAYTHAARAKGLRVVKRNARRYHNRFEHYLARARADGAETLDEITEALNRSDFKPKRCDKWQAANVRHLMKVVARRASDA